MIRLANTKKFISKTLENREKELVFLDNQKASEEKNIIKARKDMKSALEQFDAMAYREAKLTETALSDIVRNYDERRKELECKPLISKEDYDKNVNALYELGAELTVEVKKNLCKLSEEMKEMALTYSRKMDDINETLRTLQKEVYNNQDNPYDSNRKEIKYHEITYWGMSAVNSAGYNDYLRERDSDNEY